MKQDYYKKIEEQIRVIPALSPVTSQLLDIISEPTHSLLDVVNVVETDAILTSIVLKTVNSAAYSLKTSVETVVDAVRFLGDSMVAGLAMKREKSGISDANLSGYLADADASWAHSLKTAIAARYYARNFCSGQVREGVAYTAGILHDIGKSLLSSLLPAENLKSVADSEFLELEEELLGINHAEAGFMLAYSWKLPKAMCEVIRWHHSPSKASEEYRTLAYIIHLADITAMMSGSGTGVDTMRHSIDSDYVNYISVNDRSLELAFFEIQLEYNQTFKAIQACFDSGKVNDNKELQ